MERKPGFFSGLLIALIVAAIAFVLADCAQKSFSKNVDDDEIIKEVVTDFEKLAAIPRKSGHEQAVSDTLKAWAEDQGLEVNQNEVNDLIFDVPATKGYEDLPLTCLQAHIDMVCVAKDGVDYDPLNDPISVVVDEKNMIMRADGTSLGADDGIGVVMIMSIVEGDIDHGPLRIIFTTDEEEGFTGVMAVKPEDLKGVKYLINIDSEVSDTLIVSSAAGSNVVAEAEPKTAAPKGDTFLQVEISGLLGGHSGQTIGEGRCNGIIELCRLLKDLKDVTPYELVSIKGGQADNAIPDKAAAVICLSGEDKDAATEFALKREKELADKYKGIESNLKIAVTDGAGSDKVLDDAQADNILVYVTESIDGVYSMSSEVEGLVESSSNIGQINVSPAAIEIRQLPRSSSDAKLEEIHEHQSNLAEKNGLDISINDDTKAWPVNPYSTLAEQIPAIYKKQNGRDMIVTGLHAGLECAEFYRKNPSIDMVSIGPDIDDVHSPNEVVHLDSIPVTWNVLKEVLVSIK